MSTINVTPITEFSKIREFANSGDLWIINNTNLGNKRPRGVIALSVKDANGDIIPLIIPATWIPINLATMCDPILCISSQFFRDAVGKRNLIVISSEEAKEILSSASAKREAAEVEEYRSGNAAAISGADQGETTILINTTKDSSSLRTASQISNADSVQNVNPDDNILHKLIADFNSNSMSDEQVEEAFTTLKPSIEALKVAGGNIANTGSKLFEMVADAISEHS